MGCRGTVCRAAEKPARLRFWEQVLARVERPEAVFGREAHNNLERSSALFRAGRARARRRLRPEYLRVTESGLPRDRAPWQETR